MPAFNMVVCAWAIVVEVVPSPQCPSNHVDLKYRINSSASLVLGASDSTRVQAILEEYRVVQQLYGCLMVSHGVSWCLMISREVWD